MYEWENLEVEEANEMVRYRDPRKFGWGYYSYETVDEPGSFHWFESPDELLDFAKDGGLGCLDHEDEDKFLKLKETIQEVHKEMSSNEKLTNSLLRKINEVFSPAKIEWWGEFSDLCAGEDAFCRKVIHFYFHTWVKYSGKKLLKTVTEEHIPEFISFCKRMESV